MVKTAEWEDCTIAKFESNFTKKLSHNLPDMSIGSLVRLLSFTIAEIIQRLWYGRGFHTWGIPSKYWNDCLVANILIYRHRNSMLGKDEAVLFRKSEVL